MHGLYRILGLLTVAASASALVAGLQGESGDPVLPIEVRVVDAQEQSSAGGTRVALQASAPASAMMQEIRQAMAAEKTNLTALQSRLAGTDHQQALATQREIERVKQETELRILGIQAEHARSAGRTEQAAEIEQAIQAISNPPVISATSPRPTPPDHVDQ